LTSYALWLCPSRSRPSTRISRSSDALKATEQPVDTGIAVGRAFLDMLDMFGEFEINLHRAASWKGPTPPRHAASTKAVSRRSKALKSRVCAGRKSSARRRSPAGSASAGRACTACSASRLRSRQMGVWMPKKGWASGGHALARGGGRVRRLWGRNFRSS
jgi:hypothetical protein